jgi:hypothetical protein
MKRESGTQQWQRKGQALVALMTYRLAQGPIDTAPFATVLQQICADRIRHTHIDTSVLTNSLVYVDLAKLVKKKRFKRKSESLRYTYEEYAKQTNQTPGDAPLTIGDIASIWADFTSQDKVEFMTKVHPQIAALVVRYGKTNELGVKQAPENPHSEADFKFMQDLLVILIQATPQDKRDTLVTSIQNLIVGISRDWPGDILPLEVLDLAFELAVSEMVTTLKNAFSINPAAKEPLLQPLFGALMEIDAGKYGWESGVPADNSTKLQAELKEKGLLFNQRTQSRAVKALARRNVFLNLDSALAGTLMSDLGKTVLEQRTRQQTGSQTTWVYEPISAEVEAEAKKRVLELLFRRRRENDKSDRSD